MSVNRVRIPVALAIAALFATPGNAHTPHEDVRSVGISPNFDVDGTIFMEAFLSNTKAFGRSFDRGLTWEIVGQPFSPYVTSGFAFSPTFSVDGICFTATNRGGVWRSVDGGATFAQSNTGLGDLKVTDLAVSPYFAADQTMLAATPSGVYRSNDGGLSWLLSNTGLVYIDLDQVEFVPGSPGEAFVAGRAVHRSTDGGMTWTYLGTLQKTAVSLAVSPSFTTDATLAVCYGSQYLGVDVSTDGGSTWSPMTAGMSDLWVNEVEIAEDGTFVAASSSVGIYRAPSALAPWTTLAEGLETPSTMTVNHYPQIALSPTFSIDGTIAVAAYEGMHTSSDRGDTFQQADTYPITVVHGLRFSTDYANDGLIYLGTYGGGVVRVETNLDTVAKPGGTGCTLGSLQMASMYERNFGISRLWSSEIDISPDFANDDTLFYAYTKLYRSTDEGLIWSQLSLPAGVFLVRQITPSPDFANDDTLVLGAEKGQGTWMSIDRGDSWTQVTSGFPIGHTVRFVQYSPNYANDGTIYFGSQGDIGANGVFRTTDRGTTVVPLLNGLPDPVEVRSLAISPEFATDQELFVGTRMNGVYRSSDGGESWALASLGLPVGGAAHVEDLVYAPDYLTSRTLFASTLSDGVYRSIDGGNTWNRTSDGLPRSLPWRMAISPNFALDKTLLVALNDWVWFTRDRGQSWHRLPGYSRPDDIYPLVEYEGSSWVQVTDASASNRLRVDASTPGDSTSHTFHGDEIHWLAIRDANSGIADVSIDGLPPVQVDLYDPVTQPTGSVFSRYFESNDWHTIEVSVSGLSNPASGGIDVRSDGFRTGFGIGGTFETYGAGVAGTGGRRPTLLATGCPELGTTLKFNVLGAVGAALGQLEIGVSTTHRPFFGGFDLVGPPALTLYFTTSGVAGAAGVGEWTTFVPIPTDPIFAGLSAYAQVGVIDGAAVGGAALSEGLQIRIP